MLDSQHSLTLPQVPGLLLFADDRLAHGFYAVAPPRVSLDESGALQLGLMIYGQKERSTETFQVRGAVLTLTTGIELAPAEEQAALTALRQQLKAQAPADGETAVPVEPLLLAVDWLGGDIEVTLSKALTLTGTVAGVGAVRCSLQRKLDAAAAAELRRDWEAGLPHGRIVYRMRARSATGPLALTLEGTLPPQGDALVSALHLVGM